MTREIETLSNKELPSSDFEIFQTRYLDSLNVLHIIIFIESEFKISINPYDVNIEMLSTVDKITDYILQNIKE